MAIIDAIYRLFSGEERKIEFDIEGERPKLISYEIKGQSYDLKKHKSFEEDIFYQTALRVVEEAHRTKMKKRSSSLG